MKMLSKSTRSLFKGQYQYKIILVCPGARIFKDTTPRQVQEFISQTQESISGKAKQGMPRYNKIKTQAELDYMVKLYALLGSLQNFDSRIEDPWISIYTNNLSDIDLLINLNKDKVKVLYQPDANVNLVVGTIVMPRINYDFRVTLGRTGQDQSAFVTWADSNKKIKMTKSTRTCLEKGRCWGGNHFYVTGDNNLLLAKMHLGGCIAKVERIIKA